MFENKYTSIDLFSGPGGLTLGLKLAGIKPLIAVEMNREAIETYSANHDVDILDLELYLQDENKFSSFFTENKKSVLIKGDIRKVSNDLIKSLLKKRFLTEKVDLVTGGPPCESFSIAGKRLENDERDFLFLNMSRIAKAVDASMFLFENVKGVLSKKKSKSFRTMLQEICEEFERPDQNNGINFRIDSWQKEDIVLNCADYGVPQNRERVFLIGINQKYPNVHFNYPKITNGMNGSIPHVTVEEAIMDLPIVNVEEEVTEYRFDKKLFDTIESPSYKNFLKFIRTLNFEGFSIKDFSTLNSHRASKHFPKIIERMSHIQPGESMKTAAERLVREGEKHIREEYFPKKPYGARFRRLKAQVPSFTVTSHCFDEMIHPFLNRAITPREAARLQTFPDWYVFKGPYVVFHSDPKQDRYEQIGDAVPPLMAYRLGEEIVHSLDLISLQTETVL